MALGNGRRPLAQDWDWQRHATCREYPPEVFFAPEGEVRGHREQRQAAAKAVCAACPVRACCLDHAVTTGEAYGIWGGWTETERRQRSRGRSSSSR